jgi:prephenate dehydrogenase
MGEHFIGIVGAGQIARLRARNIAARGRSAPPCE